MPTPERTPEQTPDQTLERMLSDFEAAHKTPTHNPGQNFRNLIENTPQLKADILESIRRGNLEKFEAIAGPDPVGYYRAETEGSDPGKALAVSLDQLNDAATSTQTANSIRFTLGHEIQHGVNRQDIIDQDNLLREQARAIAATPSPHDYTDELRAYNATSRRVENTAEIAGFNTLASYVRSRNPDATLKDLYDASPDDMRMYIRQDLTRSPPTYTPRAGLTIGADLQIASTPANIDAMNTMFYDIDDYYPRNEAARALGLIDEAESTALDEARKTNPDQAAPELRVDLKELGLSGMALPPGFTDSSRPRRPGEPDGLAPAGADPREAGNPDNAYFNAVRGKVDPSVPDNAVAYAVVLAKKEGLNDLSKVDLDQVGYSHGKIWIGGNTPGFRIGVDPAQAPSMEQVSRELQAQQQAPDPARDPARQHAQGQETQPPAAMAR